MAQHFLARGDSVVICGRNDERLQAAVAALRLECKDAGRAHGIRCDCSSPEDVQRLGEFVQRQMGGVDIWLNNSGEVTAKRLLDEVDPHEIVRVVGSNVVGSLLGCRQAVALMRRQLAPTGATQGPRYHIFNFGFSPWGAKFTRSAVTHKATKRALAQLNESLAQELLEAGVNTIGVHNLSPGMLLTDLLLRDSTPAARRFFNALAEEPETVAAALVPRVRSVQGSGTSIDYLTPAGALLRILSGLPQIINGGRFFDREGRRVEQAGEAYQENGVRVQVQQRQEQRLE